MTQADPGAGPAAARAAGALARGLRSLVLRFLLPLILLLGGLFVAEAAAEQFGYHLSGAQLSRLVMVGLVLAVVIGHMIRKQGR